MRANIIGFIFILILGFLQYRLWIEPSGIKDVVRLKRKLATQMSKNEYLKKENEELLSQLDRLHHSKEAAESRARNELGMIKEGESFYQVVKGS